MGYILMILVNARGAAAWTTVAWPWFDRFGSFNCTLWTQQNDIEHCNDGACFMADPGHLQYGNIGLLMSLNQVPCNSTGCCIGGACANWTAGHLATAGKYLYGTFTMTGQPAHSGASSAPPTNAFSCWTAAFVGSPIHNEIVMCFSGFGGVQFVHFTYWFNNSVNGVETIKQLPFAWSAAVHEYKVVWSPSQLDWYIDGQLLHSDYGTAGVDIPYLAGQTLIILRPKSNVYLGDSTFTVVNASYNPSYAPYVNVSSSATASPSGSAASSVTATASSTGTASGSSSGSNTAMMTATANGSPTSSTTATASSSGVSSTASSTPTTSSTSTCTSAASKPSGQSPSASSGSSASVTPTVSASSSVAQAPASATVTASQSAVASGSASNTATATPTGSSSVAQSMTPMSSQPNGTSASATSSSSKAASSAATLTSSMTSAAATSPSGQASSLISSSSGPSTASTSTGSSSMAASASLSATGAASSSSTPSTLQSSAAFSVTMTMSPSTITSPVASGSPLLLPSFSALPSVDPNNATAFNLVSVRFILAGARPVEALLPSVLLPFLNAIASVLGVPTANVVVVSYQDRSSQSQRRMLQSGGTVATVLSITVRTTPSTPSATSITNALTAMTSDTLALIANATSAALANATGRPAASFVTTLDVQSIVTTAGILAPASSSVGNQGGGSTSAAQLAGAVVGAVVGALALAVAIAIIARRSHSPTAASRGNGSTEAVMTVPANASASTIVPIAPTGAVDLYNPAIQRQSLSRAAAQASGRGAAFPATTTRE